MTWATEAMPPDAYSRQILQNVFRSTEWRLGVDDPFGVRCIPEPGVEARRFGQVRQLSEELQFARGECLA
jgi:hypothetical protein